MVPTDMSAYVDLFCAETREHLTAVEEAMARLVESPDDTETIRELYRHAHSIKGMAASMSYTVVSDLAHAIEDLFELLKRGTRRFGPSLRGPVGRAFDEIAGMIDQVAAGRTPVGDTASHIDAMRALAAGAAPAQPAEPLPPRDYAPPEIAEAARTSREPTNAEAGKGPAAGSVRVAAASLDRLLDSLGETLVLLGRIDGRARGRIDRDADLVLDELRRLVGRLHGDLMSARLLPFETVAHRFVRTVRETGEALGRDVVLEIVGRQVQLDLSVVEAIVDPINHVLRNALAHGIEAPAERAAAGKPRRATISISLERLPNAVTIRIADDGRGMSPEALRKGAVESGLLSAEEASRLSDGEALMLATLPGVSTASRVSGLSGRGVGMNVVRGRVEGLGGRLILDSVPGAGTAVEMRLPITILVVPAFLVEAGGRCWAVPVSAVARTLQIGLEEIVVDRGRPTLLLEEGRIPLIDLALELALNGKGPLASSRREVLLARAGPRSIALAVDRIVRKKEIVVRSLGPPLEELPPYAGAALLDDGRITLLIDPLAFPACRRG
jgi:two-component system chemotaxis sensor kinase CheA